MFLFAQPGNPNHENILILDILFIISEATLERTTEEISLRSQFQKELLSKMNLSFLLLDTRNHVEKLIWTRDLLSKNCHSDEV